MPEISIIVPVYNTEPYLARCVDSILIQSFADFELLLVDDGSTDDSGAICDAYAEKDNRICVFHKENGGVSSARNLGLQGAKGEWICFVDSDDELLPNGLRTMVDGITDEVDIVMAGYYELEGEMLQTDTSGFGGDGTIDQNKALLMMYPSADLPYQGYSWGKLFKRNLIVNRSVSFDEHIRIKEDTLFVVEYLCGSTKLARYISMPVYKYVKLPIGVMGGMRQSYNPNYLTSFDAVVKMNDLVQSLPNRDKALSEAAKYEVVNRVYLVYGHMLDNGAVEKNVVKNLKTRAIREVGLGYYMGYQYRRNKRRIEKLFKKLFKKMQ